MSPGLKSKIVEYGDYWTWFEEACHQGLTDGLVLAPPTVERVGAILDYLRRDPQEVVGVIPPLEGILTVEVLAIQCAMAGCLPAHVPVVEAAVRAMLDPAFNVKGVQTTTNACAPLVIVNGPIVRELGFNAGAGCFGGGSRASAAVGRAVRLILWNAGGGIPGDTDMAPHGHPGKFTFCVAENESDIPWEPLSAQQGLPQGQNAVTVFACQAPQPVYAPGNADRVLRILADTLPVTGSLTFCLAGQVLLAMGLTPARELARAGWTKAALKQWLWDNARYDLGYLRERGLLDAEGDRTTTYWGHVEGRPDISQMPDAARLPMVEGPEHIHIIVAGSEHQWWIQYLPGWGGLGGYAITRPVKAPA